MTINEDEAITIIDQSIASTRGDYVASEVSRWGPDEMRENLMLITEAFEAASTAIQASENIVTSITEAIVVSKQIDALVEKTKIDLERDIIKYRQSLPMIEKQIDRYGDHLDRLMDDLMAIDPANANEHVRRWRSQLITLIMDKNDKIQELLMTVLEG